MSATSLHHRSTRTVGVGPILRHWRQARRMSQLDLAVEAEVSTRHLSFVETGRSRPSRELLIHLAEHLDVPLRERNHLLLAAGYAPVYRESTLDDPDLAPVRAALDRILASHAPFPSIVVDQHWDLVTANAPALRVMSDGVAPHLLADRPNALRISLHPEGLAPRIANLAEFSAHLLSRLRRQAGATGDSRLLELHDELRAHPGVDPGHQLPSDPASQLFVPLRLVVPDGEWSFFSTLSTFGTALDITVAELAIESFFPADDVTAEALRAADATAG